MKIEKTDFAASCDIGSHAGKDTYVARCNGVRSRPTYMRLHMRCPPNSKEFQTIPPGTHLQSLLPPTTGVHGTYMPHPPEMSGVSDQVRPTFSGSYGSSSTLLPESGTNLLSAISDRIHQTLNRFCYTQTIIGPKGREGIRQPYKNVYYT